jgi:hypothetical protein
MKINMTARITNYVLPGVALLCLACPVPGQETGKPASDTAAAPPAGQTVRDVYRVVQIDEFYIQKGVEFPPIYLGALQTEIRKQLASAKLFAEIVTEGQKPANPQNRVLRLSGLITNYNPGNRATR